MLELIPDKRDRKQATQSTFLFYEETSTTLQSPKFFETPASATAHCGGWSCQGAEAQAEGEHNSHGKEHIAVLCGDYVNFNCWGTMLLHNTHSLGL